MSEHTPTGATPQEPSGSEPVRLDQGHVQGSGERRLKVNPVLAHPVPALR